ncbi:MAG: class I SAM-dependent methyltransferase [Candidatus Freyarchaeota archaeon]|nr:class I SAM-dependent methyltransferase [Candidatus Jordarchaeia archaeon]
MNKKIAFLYEVLKSPRLFLEQLKVLKDINKYMRLIAVDALAPALSRLQIGESVELDAFMKAEEFVDRPLLTEILRLVEEEGIVKVREGKLTLLRYPPRSPFPDAINKAHPTIREAFGTFIEPTIRTVRERLSGKATREFDVGELKVHWSIALEGEFYRVQREKAIAFARLMDEAKKRRGTFRVLDYGCGGGVGTVQIYNHLSGAVDDFEVDGCDVSEGLLEVAREDVSVGLPIHFFSLKEEKPSEGLYDAIFVSHVLHWTEDPAGTIGELKKYLKPDGFIFGIESTLSKRLYPVDLFIRIHGARGFPTFSELKKWFDENKMKLEFEPVWFSFKATQ